ncbi:MAG: 3-deoxy-D-manno-octulosonic acid transferase [Acidocella sp.]|nr:3-deoxy-D-manno-octulosonic acid transferase [Acidocella sp.]
MAGKPAGDGRGAERGDRPGSGTVVSWLGLYCAAGRIGTPVLRALVRRRVALGKEDGARCGERFGITTLPRPAGRLIWLHAASVGEMVSILPVIEALSGRARVLLTTGTLTSAELAQARLPDGAVHQFIPLDSPAWVARFLDQWRPDAAVFVESELWPGMLDACDSRGIPRLLINARMSARSANAWARFGGLRRVVLGPFRYVHAQSAGDAENLHRLGVSDVLEWGNLKFAARALPVDEAKLAAFRAAVPGTLWLAASTHPGEEEMIFTVHEAVAAIYPDLVTVIIPRHPERGTAVAALGRGMPAPRRALAEAPVPGRVYVADTLGEMGLFFRAAPFAFIGNSLCGFGGHNLVEPAMLGRPVITGPHIENFMEAAAMLRAAGALAAVADRAGLERAVRAWLDDCAAATKAGQRAKAAFAEDAALPARLADLIMECAT